MRRTLASEELRTIICEEMSPGESIETLRVTDEATFHLLADYGFMVAGRELADTYRTLADVDVPDEFRDLFSAIPPEAFRSDLSSTELRKDMSDAE